MRSLISTLILLSILCCFKVQSQSNLVLQNPQVETGSFLYLHALDSLHVLGFRAESKRQILLSTQNGGQSWKNRKFNLGVPVGFYGMDFGPGKKIGLSPLTGLNNVRTTDGGYTWATVPTPNNVGFFLFDFLTDSLVFAHEMFGLVYKSTNGGLSWAPVNTPITNVQSPGLNFPEEIQSVNDSVMIYRGDYKVFRTSNMGQSWQEISQGFRLVNATLEYDVITKVHSHLLLVRGDSGRIGRSVDLGNTWSRIQLPGILLSAKITEIIPIDSLFCFATTNTGQIYKTEDGGLTWIVVNAKLPFAFGKRSRFLNKTQGFAAGEYGGIYGTQNGGISWKPILNGNIESNSNVVFQGKNRVWMISSSDERQWEDYSLPFRKSDDRGLTWKKVKGPACSKLQFPSSSVAFAGIPELSKSSNGGLSWKQIIPDSIRNAFSLLEDFDFPAPKQGFALFNKGVAVTDGANNWNISINKNYQGSTWQFRKVVCVDSLNAFVFADSSFNSFSQSNLFCFKTTNGGANWLVQQTGIGSGTIRLISVPDPQNVFIYFTSSVSQSQSGLYRSINGADGFSFLSQSVSNSDLLTEMKFYSPNSGYIFVLEKGLFKTEDAGQTWAMAGDSLPNCRSIYSLLLNQDGSIRLAVGESGIVYTDATWSGPKPTIVSGYIAKEENTNCQIDSSESLLPMRVVSAEPGHYFANTDSSGRYDIVVDTGSYIISQLTPEGSFAELENQVCPTNSSGFTVSILEPSDTILAGNFLNKVTLCPRLELNITHSTVRPCQYSNARIDVINSGSLVSDPDSVQLRFPAFLKLTTSLLPFRYDATDSSFYFRIPAIQPLHKFQFWVEDSVSCNTDLTGQILCVKATIHNLPPCLLQSPNWDGADLEVASRCQNGQTKFTLHNKGAAMSSTSQYKIFIDSALVYQAPFQLAANGSMTVSLPINAPAGFVRLVVPQSANHPLSTFASAEANCATGQSTNGMFPPPDESPLVDIECVTVQNSYDPNDKQVFPTGWGADGNVEPGTEFKYTVRFQNTGTDTAFKVVLVDTLDQDLDIASLQIGNGSHTYSFKVSGKGRPVLTWTFDNILLPDSNTNEEKSHGFVSFSVRPKVGLVLGTRLENFVDIYFDFNDPVRTNTTVNTLWVPTLDPGVLDTVFVTEVKQKLAAKSLTIRPNPAQNVITIQLPDENTGQLEITDLQGRILQTSQIVSGQGISIKDLKPGVYFLKTEGYKAERLVVKP